MIIINEFDTIKTTTKLRCRFWDKRIVINSTLIGSTIELYNGKRFIRIKLSSDMVGHRVGEFILTRKQRSHSH
ncbi:MAG: ribosomal protein S19 family protein [Candidatus Hodgkinia cicadicola]